MTRLISNPPRLMVPLNNLSQLIHNWFQMLTKYRVAPECQADFESRQIGVRQSNPVHPGIGNLNCAGKKA